MIRRIRFWRQRRAQRDLFLRDDIAKGEPHRRTVNGMMKELLGIGPNDKAVDSETLQFRREMARIEMQELRQGKKVTK